MSRKAQIHSVVVPALAILLGGCGLSLAQKENPHNAGTAAQAADATEWPTFGHDSGGMRYSPLTQINVNNVSDLTVAWIYHMKREGDATPSGGRGGQGGRRPGGP